MVGLRIRLDPAADPEAELRLVMVPGADEGGE